MTAQLPARGWMVLIFLLAFLPRLAYVAFVDPPNPAMSPVETIRVADNFARTGKFANPYKIPTGPTAHLTPVYPIFMALCFKAIGMAKTYWLLKILSAAAASLIWALLPWVAVIFGLPLRSGAAAGALGALLPVNMWVETNGVWETVWGSTLEVILIAALYRCYRRKVPAIHWLLLGLAAGFTVLLQASILTVLIAGTGVISLHTLYKGNPRLLIRLAAFPLGLLVAVTPWLLRNYHALGGLVPLRSNGGLEYYVSFWDGTGLALNDAIYAFHPHQNEAEARKVRDMGEIAYNAELSRQTREWIRTHPERFRELTIRRFFGFWVFPEESLWKQVIKAILSVAGWLGFLLSLKRYGASMLVLAAPLWAFPIPYYFHLVDPRYSYPAFWPLVFFSALLFTRRFTVQESD